MPINWRLAAPEVRYILEHSEARALVCDESLVEVADQATAGLEAHCPVRACVGRRRAGGLDAAGRPARCAGAAGPRRRSRPTTSTA